MLLEQIVANLYVFLYGISGRRATVLFSFLAEALDAELSSGATDALYSHALTILTALLMVLECN